MARMPHKYYRVQTATSPTRESQQRRHEPTRHLLCKTED